MPQITHLLQAEEVETLFGLFCLDVHLLYSGLSIKGQLYMMVCKHLWFCSSNVWINLNQHLSFTFAKIVWAWEGRTLYSFTPHCPPNSRTSWNFRDCHITKPIIRPSATHMKWFFGPVQNNFLYLMAHYYCLLHILCLKMLKFKMNNIWKETFRNEEQI